MADERKPPNVSLAFLNADVVRRFWDRQAPASWYVVWDAYMAGATDALANPSATREEIGKAGEAWCYLSALSGPKRWDGKEADDAPDR